MPFAAARFVTVNDRNLAYEEARPPNPRGVIVLLAGLGAKRQGWYKQLPVFGRTYRTFALDYRDVGESDARATLPKLATVLRQHQQILKSGLGLKRYNAAKQLIKK